MFQEPFLVRQSWPEPTVAQQLDMFERLLAHGLDAESLADGLQCFAFLARRADLSEALRTRLAAAVTAAQDRLDAMSGNAALAEAQADAMLERLRAAMRNVQAFVGDASSVEDLLDEDDELIDAPLPAHRLH